MKEKLDALLLEGKQKIESVKNETELQDIKALLLGKQSPLTEMLKELCLLYTSPSPRDS